MYMFLSLLKWMHILRTEILWVFAGSVTGVALLVHLVPGVEHGVLLDVGMVLLIVAAVILYDKVSHRHDEDFTYHIDHDRLEKACHLEHGHHHTHAHHALGINKTPDHRPGASSYHVERKFSGRE